MYLYTPKPAYGRLWDFLNLSFFFTTGRRKDEVDVPMADPGWGIWGKCPPPLHLVEEPAMLLIKIASKFCQANRDQFKTHENIHILLAFIRNSPETKAQTNCKIVIQHLRAY